MFSIMLSLIKSSRNGLKRILFSTMFNSSVMKTFVFEACARGLIVMGYEQDLVFFLHLPRMNAFHTLCLAVSHCYILVQPLTRRMTYSQLLSLPVVGFP